MYPINCPFHVGQQHENRTNYSILKRLNMLVQRLQQRAMLCTVSMADNWAAKSSCSPPAAEGSSRLQADLCDPDKNCTAVHSNGRNSIKWILFDVRCNSIILTYFREDFYHSKYVLAGREGQAGPDSPLLLEPLRSCSFNSSDGVTASTSIRIQSNLLLFHSYSTSFSKASRSG